MDDHLALLVGRVILAWGELDQHLHISLRNIPGIMGEQAAKEKRFSERRKLFRRYCVARAQDDSFNRRLDQFLGTLAKLETSRGLIAHGFAVAQSDGVAFIHVPDFATQNDAPRVFTRADLTDLEIEIDDAKLELIWLALEAGGFSDPETPQAPAQSQAGQILGHLTPSGQSTPGARGKE